MVVDSIGIMEIIAVGIVTLHNQSEQIENLIAIVVERRSGQRIATSHLFLNPFLVESLQCDALVALDGRDQPDQLLDILYLTLGLNVSQIMSTYLILFASLDGSRLVSQMSAT